MDNQEEDLSRAIIKYPKFNMFRLKNCASLLEIRLFYVRISPCDVRRVPDHLTLRHLRREIGVSLEINGNRIPSSDTASLTLRRDRVDKESSEVTYVSTDSVKISGPVEFEVHEEDMILCGSLERMEASWSNGLLESGDSKTGWSMDCYSASSGSSSAFFKPKHGISSTAIEVYIAGCCSSVPVILTKTIQISPRRKVSRHGMLDAIPEDEEILKEKQCSNGLVPQELQITESDVDDDVGEGKFGRGYYSEDIYGGEDGQLSWFNAGVRVGVGISLGMCVGVGIGVGLLLRSYQTTTKNLRRRFF